VTLGDRTDAGRAQSAHDDGGTATRRIGDQSVARQHGGICATHAEADREGDLRPERRRGTIQNVEGKFDPNANGGKGAYLGGAGRLLSSNCASGRYVVGGTGSRSERYTASAARPAISSGGRDTMPFWVTGAPDRVRAVQEPPGKVTSVYDCANVGRHVGWPMRREDHLRRGAHRAAQDPLERLRARVDEAQLVDEQREPAIGMFIEPAAGLTRHLYETALHVGVRRDDDVGIRRCS